MTSSTQLSTLETSVEDLSFTKLDQAKLLPFLAEFESVSDSLVEQRKLLRRREEKYALPTEELVAFLQGLRGSYQLLKVNENPISSYQTRYWDTRELELLRRGANPGTQNSKVRSRHYLDRELCMLEVKHSSYGNMSRKERLPRAKLDLDTPFSPHELNFLRRHLPQLPSALLPQVLVQYSRISLVSLTAMERVTIDLNLHYRNELSDTYLHGAAIVEIKEEESRGNESFAGSWLQKAGICSSHFSKYRVGLWLSGQTEDSGCDISPWAVEIRP